MVDGICPLDGHDFEGKTPEKKVFCEQIHITEQPILLCKRWVGTACLRIAEREFLVSACTSRTVSPAGYHAYAVKE